MIIFRLAKRAHQAVGWLARLVRPALHSGASNTVVASVP